MTEDQIRTHVAEAIRNARENGYWMASSYDSGEVHQLCVDLLDCDAAVEGLGVDDVRPHVEAHLRRTGQYRG